MSITRQPALAALVLLLGGCGDSITAPPSGAQGTWVYTMFTERLDNTPQPGEVQCQIFEATMALSGSGPRFEGTIDGGISCAFVGVVDPRVVFSNRISDGLIAGDAVTFRIGIWEHTGTFTDGSMSGSIVMEVTVDGSPVILRGDWSATRQ